jgi:hypothetical protein
MDGCNLSSARAYYSENFGYVRRQNVQPAHTGVWKTHVADE